MGFSTATLDGEREIIMPLSSKQKRYADIAESRGYLPAYRAILKETCASFWWHGRDDLGRYRILQNGTVCFIDTGTELIAVTAAHVLEGYISAKRQHPQIVCQLGNITYDPENHVVDINTRLDLATFRASSVVVAGAGCSPSTPLCWPPASVSVGDILLCGGHPGAIREENESTTNLPFQWFLASAASCNDNIALCLDLGDCYVPLTGGHLSNKELGGMSGGPVFKYIPPSPLERIELVGFIYEFQPAYELMFARPARFIDKHGQINAVAV